MNPIKRLLTGKRTVRVVLMNHNMPWISREFLISMSDYKAERFPAGWDLPLEERYIKDKFDVNQYGASRRRV